MTAEWPASILCPVDFSESSAAALRLAGRLAQALPSKRTALHAHSWEAPAYFTESRVAGLAEEFRRSLTDAERTLRDFLQIHCPGCVAATLIVDSSPVAAVLDTAHKLGADLIVMGTHGRRGFNRLLLGSITERVLREARIPVLTLREPLPDRESLPRNVLCAIDDSAVSRQALSAAARIATASGATLTALRVASSPGSGEMDSICDSLSSHQRSACRLRTITRTGEPANEILDAALEHSAGLLVIGGRHRLFRDVTILGATTVRLVRHSPVPVLTVFTGGDDRP